MRRVVQSFLPRPRAGVRSSSVPKRLRTSFTLACLLVLLCFTMSNTALAAKLATVSPIRKQPQTLAELYLNKVMANEARLGLARKARTAVRAASTNAPVVVPLAIKPIAKTVPLLAYHHLAPPELNLHTQFREVTTPQQFEKDLIYLRDNGYVTVFFGDLLDALQGKRALPDKPAVVFFDDGYQSNYIYAWPILKKLNMKATINVISSKVVDHQNGTYNPAQLSFLAWDQIKEMVDSGLVDIQSHTHNLHDSTGTQPPIMTATEQTLRQDFAASKQAIEQHTHKPVIVLSYPNVAYTDLSDKVGREFFQISLGALGADALGKPLGIGTKRLNVSYYFDAAYRLTH